VVRVEGLEPPRLAAPEPKSNVSYCSVCITLCDYTPYAVLLLTIT